MKVRVELPAHLRTLAKTAGREIEVTVEGTPTIQSVLDALEQNYPMLCGTIRDHTTLERRAFLRFFACERDLTHDPPGTPLPPEVVEGREPLLGAIAGGT
jgi:hypothetical protein